MCDLGSTAASDEGNGTSSSNTSKCGKRYLEAPYLDNGVPECPLRRSRVWLRLDRCGNGWQFFVELQL